MAQIAKIGLDGAVTYDDEDLPDLTPPYVEPAKTTQTIASAKLSIVDGVIDGFAVDSAIAGGFALDTGSFWLFFAVPQPDANYIVNVFDGGLFRCYVKQEDYGTDSFIVTTTDFEGNPADPASISMVVIRAL